LNDVSDAMLRAKDVEEIAGKRKKKISSSESKI